MFLLLHFSWRSAMIIGGAWYRNPEVWGMLNLVYAHTHTYTVMWFSAWVEHHRKPTYCFSYYLSLWGLFYPPRLKQLESTHIQVSKLPRTRSHYLFILYELFFNRHLIYSLAQFTPTPSSHHTSSKDVHSLKSLSCFLAKIFVWPVNSPLLVFPNVKDGFCCIAYRLLPWRWPITWLSAWSYLPSRLLFRTFCCQRGYFSGRWYSCANLIMISSLDTIFGGLSDKVSVNVISFLCLREGVEPALRLVTGRWNFY